MSNPRYNQKLFQLVVAGLAGLGEKQAFTPAPQADPNAQGGQPQDPLAAMGAPPTGQQQMDPGMMAALQQQGGGGQPQPGMAPDGLPANEQAPEEGKPEAGDIKTEIRNVLTEAGVIKPPKLKPEDHFLWTKAAIEKICKQLGIDAPPLPDTSNMTMKNGAGSGGGSGAGAMTAGMSGGPSDQALGSMTNQPLDPAQQAAVGGGGGDPSMAKAANISTKSASIREALQRLRK